MTSSSTSSATAQVALTPLCSDDEAAVLLVYSDAPTAVTRHTFGLRVAQGVWLCVLPDPNNEDGYGEFDGSPFAALEDISDLFRLAGDPNWQTPDVASIGFIDGFTSPPESWAMQAYPVAQVDKDWLRRAARTCGPEEWRAVLRTVADYRSAYSDVLHMLPTAARLLAIMEGTLRAAAAPLRASA